MIDRGVHRLGIQGYMHTVPKMGLIELVTRHFNDSKFDRLKVLALNRNGFEL